MTVKPFLRSVVRALARPDVIFLPKARDNASPLLYALARSAPSFHDDVVVPGIARVDYSARADSSAPVREPSSDVPQSEASRDGGDVPAPPLSPPRLGGDEDETAEDRAKRLRSSSEKDVPGLDGPPGPRF